MGVCGIVYTLAYRNKEFSLDGKITPSVSGFEEGVFKVPLGETPLLFSLIRSTQFFVYTISVFI